MTVHHHGNSQCFDHQPFTPFTETLRGLLLGTEIGSDGVVSVA